MTINPVSSDGPSSKKLTGGVIAGIVVGGVFLLAIAIFLTWWLIRRKKRNQVSELADTSPRNEPTPATPYSPWIEDGGIDNREELATAEQMQMTEYYNKHEVDATKPVQEVEGKHLERQNVSELDGGFVGYEAPSRPRTAEMPHPSFVRQENIRRS